MLHAILSILVGALGGLSARVVFSFAASVALLPLSLFSSRRETQVSTVQAALALCLLVIAVSLYDFAVIKSWKGIVEHLTWGDYIGIVVFCISSACIPDSRAADMAGDCKYNSMILNAGVYFSLFIPVGFLLMDCSENMWSYLSFIIVFLLFSFFLIDFHCSKKSMKQIFADGNNYPEIEIEKKRWAGRKWRMIAIIISVCFLTAFSVVQLFNGKKYAHENETVELDHTRLMDLGEQYLNKGDVERAVSCFKKSAEFGNAKAQRWLGACYYFGEHLAEPCGHCSSCQGNFVERDITVEAQKILSGVARVERMYPYGLGVNQVIHMLRGSRNQRVLGLKLDTLPTYGILREVPREQVQIYVDCLVERGYLVVTKTEFPVVHLTAQARRVLFEGERVLASLAVPTREAPALPQTEAAEPVGPLMGELKALRTRLAQAEGVPAYIIFSNATLAGMAAKLPTTMEDLLEVSGVGAVKAARYGEAFLDVIREYLEI